MTNVKALQYLYKKLIGGRPRNTIAKILEDIADNYEAPTPAANVAKAAGAAPTKAEFDALIGALIDAGLMEDSGS